MSGGAGDATIEITAMPNMTPESRSAEVIIVCDETIKKTIPFSQAQKDFLVVAEESYFVEQDGGEITVTLGHNVEFDIEIDVDWIEDAKTRAYVEDELLFVVAKDLLSEERKGHITFISKDKKTEQKVVVTQAAYLNVDIPDPAFKSYLIDNFDLDGDGELSIEEALKITKIEIGQDDYGYNDIGIAITSLKGLESMPNLVELNFEAVDWDNYDNAFLGNLSSIDLSQNKALEYLSITFCPLDELDISHNTELIGLNCESNALTKLDVTKNTKLKYLYCGMENNLTSLDVSQNRALQELCCGFDGSTMLYLTQNEKGMDILRGNLLTSLDVSNNPDLVFLDCASNKITSLDVSKNSKLQVLLCYTNAMTALDVSNNSKLSYLKCGAEVSGFSFPTNVGNEITELNVSNMSQLENLICATNQLTELDLSDCSKLRELICGYNRLESLDLHKNTALEALYCNKNEIKSLDFSMNPLLSVVNCNSNELTELSLSGYPYLFAVQCDDNMLTTIDVSNSENLDALYCAKNNLTEIDLSTNQWIQMIKTLQNPDLETIWVWEGFDTGNLDYVDIDDWTEFKVANAAAKTSTRSDYVRKNHKESKNKHLDNLFYQKKGFNGYKYYDSNQSRVR